MRAFRTRVEGSKQSPDRPFQRSKGVGRSNQRHIKNHNWAAIVWAEEKVPLYHQIFASNETVPGQPPEEQAPFTLTETRLNI